ncbi:kinase activator [Lithospermum erythrorhizon]|uniref:Kinase activator n=1 Tax=Lithospermum erythrorhizon TaxID=34254 RepID=A0AAV3PHB5_LITER
MDKENISQDAVCHPPMRITRSRAKGLGSSGGLPPIYPSTKENGKQVLRASSKKEGTEAGVSSRSSHQYKTRGGLKDVTNSTCADIGLRGISSTKPQVKKGVVRKHENSMPACNRKKQRVLNTGKEHLFEVKNEVNAEGLQGTSSIPYSVESNAVLGNQFTSTTKFHKADNNTVMPNLRNLFNIRRQQKEAKLSQKQEELDGLDIIDIDSKHKDPQMCSLYAPDIYQHLKAMELGRRPLADYMEKMQKDITQTMRGILIDWLVEVAEEYRLVPDTLYLTVNLIDRFLSNNYVEKQKLQLLGVTCMLIASKYEEICAPRVEEFCFITDNTYSKEEVVKMESHILNYSGFHLSIPTTKKFLRRYIQAAQASYKVPSVELEFLANYLAELSLLEYSFLKFLPSLIAASAVFLARWTLDQSDNPWNHTLEHYTSYKQSELKMTVLALKHLQLNTSGCTLHAVREKYKLPKFKSVANLSTTKPVESLF